MTNRQHAVDQCATGPRDTGSRDIDNRLASDDDFFDLSKMTKQEIAAELVRRHQAFHAEVDGDGFGLRADGRQSLGQSAAPLVETDPPATRHVGQAARQEFGAMAKLDAVARPDPGFRNDPIGRSDARPSSSATPSAVKPPVQETSPPPASLAPMVKPNIAAPSITADDLRVPEDDIRSVSVPAAKSKSPSKKVAGLGTAFLWGMISGILLLGLALAGVGAIYLNPHLSMRWPQLHTLVQSFSAPANTATTVAPVVPPAVPAASVTAAPGAQPPASAADPAPAMPLPVSAAPVSQVPVSQAPSPQQASSSQQVSPVMPSPVVTAQPPAPSIPAMPPATTPATTGAVNAAPVAAAPGGNPASDIKQPPKPAASASPAVPVKPAPVKSISVKPTSAQPSKAWLMPQPFEPSNVESAPTAAKSGNAKSGNANSGNDWLTPQPFDPNTAPAP